MPQFVSHCKGPPSRLAAGTQFTAFRLLCLQYKLNVRRQVRGKAERALAALQQVQPDAAHLSVERDILPKLEVSRRGRETCWAGCGWHQPAALAAVEVRSAGQAAGDTSLPLWMTPALQAASCLQQPCRWLNTSSQQPRCWGDACLYPAPHTISSACCRSCWRG